MHLLKSAAAAVLCLSLTAIAAEASYPPIKYTRTRADLAAACTALGPRGQGYGFDQQTGPYGCRDIESGNAVTCKGDGSCTDYSGDPRWKKIHDWLNGNAPQRMDTLA